MVDEQIFNAYKRDLLDLASHNENTLRYIAIEYVTSFPKIDPIEMACCMLQNNIDVIFDDSTKTTKENEALYRKVQKYYKTKITTK